MARHMKFETKTALFPFSPGKSPVFYGWIILAVSAAGVAMSIPGQTMGVSVFTDYLLAALNLSRLTLSTAYLIGTLGSAIVLPFIGRLYDITGARLIGAVTALSFGSLLLGFSAIDGMLSTLTGIFPAIPPGVMAFILITLGFFLLRFLGQGVLAMISRNMSMKWFEKKRGLANAILGTAISFSFSYAPRLLNGLIESRGWRGAYRMEGFIVGGIFSVVFFLLARDNPEVCKLVPDGKAGKAPAVKERKDTGVIKSLTLSEARKQLRFWMYSLALSIFGLFSTGLTFHIFSIFTEVGMERNDAVSIFLPAAIISVSINFIVSWASDFIRLKVFLLIEVAAQILCMAALVFLKQGLPYVLLIVGYGITGGLFGLLSTVTWPKFYGTKHLGAISGFSFSMLVAGSAVGPLFFSACLKFLGSYSYAGLFSMIFCAALFIVSVFMRSGSHDPLLVK